MDIILIRETVHCFLFSNTDVLANCPLVSIKQIINDDIILEKKCILKTRKIALRIFKKKNLQKLSIKDLYV